MPNKDGGHKTMRIRIHQLVVPLDYEARDVLVAAAGRLGRPAWTLSDVTVVRRSVDARKRRDAPVFVLSVEAELAGDPPKLVEGHVELVAAAAAEPAAEVQHLPSEPVNLAGRRVVVIGAGPAGLMAALALAEAHLAPLVVERGGAVEDRRGRVGRFWHAGLLDPESNVLYGEGGAGLFSDGKLTSRSKDRPRVRRMLETLLRCGAPADILVESEPHLGSDVLGRIVTALRGLILSAGGQVRFGARLDGLEIEGGRLRAVHVAGQRVAVAACVLATGHSARDVYRMLHAAGVTLEAKAFAVGLRAELGQRLIDRAQWGRWAGRRRLGAASFRMTRPESPTARPCYTFCMCPGGVVISCASEPGMLTTNGMSLSARDGRFGNAAFLAPVGPADYPQPGGDLPAELAGLAFQADIERRAFQAGGADYWLPAARLTDFLAGSTGGDLPADRSCTRSRPADLRTVLPEFVSRTLAEAMPEMLSRQRGLAPEDVTLYAAETRTSSPVRVVRGPTGQSPAAAGLFPAGEGAGYSGGIISSGVDGLRAAEAVLRSVAGSR
jgi:hypothetical protein